MSGNVTAMTHELKNLAREDGLTEDDLQGRVPEPRREVRLTIYYSSEQQKLVRDYAVNISTGGLFIETTNVLPVDTPLVVVFALPARDILITCNTRVAWTNEPGSLKKLSLPPGMGLQFLDLPLETMYLIREFLSRGEVIPFW
jgi:uncharacterized protein (TIGR02266 family)